MVWIKLAPTIDPPTPPADITLPAIRFPVTVACVVVRYTELSKFAPTVNAPTSPLNNAFPARIFPPIVKLPRVVFETAETTLALV